VANSDERCKASVQRSTLFVEETVSTHAVDQLSRAELLQQLERILNSKYFRNSKRYPALLRFVVEQTLVGQSQFLKERTLGMTVFDRCSDYDTSLDPIVRVTAGEVRKRIAQYYQEPGHLHEWKIELPLGSYVPRFEFPADHTASAPAETVDHPAPMAAPRVSDGRPASLVPSARTKWGHWKAFALLAIMISFVATFALLASKSPADRTLNSAGVYFWKPMLSSRNPVLITLGVHSLDRGGNDMPRP